MADNTLARLPAGYVIGSLPVKYSFWTSITKSARFGFSAITLIVGQRKKGSVRYWFEVPARKMPPTVRSVEGGDTYGFWWSNHSTGGTNFVLLSLDGEEAWLVVLGLADPPHPVHFLRSHWTLVERVKRGSQIGDGSGS